MPLERSSSMGCSFGKNPMGSNKPVIAGSLNKYGFKQADDVWSIGGVSPTILAHLQGQLGHQINILLEEEADGEVSKANP